MSDWQEKPCILKPKVHANIFESANPKPTRTWPEWRVKPIAKLAARNNSQPDISTRPVFLNCRKRFRFFFQISIYTICTDKPLKILWLKTSGSPQNTMPPLSWLGGQCKPLSDKKLVSLDAPNMWMGHKLMVNINVHSTTTEGYVWKVFTRKDICNLIHKLYNQELN